MNWLYYLVGFAVVWFWIFKLIAATA